MASVYKRQRNEPVPLSAKIVEIVKPVPKRAKINDGERLAMWRDSDGLRCSAPLSDDGAHVIMRVAQWVDETGVALSAPLSSDGACVIRLSRKYQCKYRDASGRWVQESTGTSDKSSAQRIAKEREAQAKLRQEGIVDARTERATQQGKRPIGEVVSDYISHLATKGGTEKHRTRTLKYINEFIGAGKWATIADIEPDTVTQAAKERLDDGMAPRTVQARVTAVKGFTRWLVPDKWFCDPLAGVKKPSPLAQMVRRMLLPDEWTWLRSAIESSNEILGLSGADRLTLYMLAIETGLRANEIAGLTRGKLFLTASPPYVTCKAAGTKNRKPAKQYITPELAERLGAMIARKSKAAPVFVFEDRYALAEMIRTDLAAARREWIRAGEHPDEVIRRGEDDFLADTNAEGEVFDFHSLRHTCGAWLAIAGEHPKVIQSVMRHSTITLTMDRYGHLFPGQDAEAVTKIAAVMNGSIRPNANGASGLTVRASSR